MASTAMEVDERETSMMDWEPVLTPSSSFKRSLDQIDDDLPRAPPAKRMRQAAQHGPSLIKTAIARSVRRMAYLTRDFVRHTPSTTYHFARGLPFAVQTVGAGIPRLGDIFHNLVFAAANGLEDADGPEIMGEDSGVTGLPGAFPASPSTSAAVDVNPNEEAEETPHIILQEDLEFTAPGAFPTTPTTTDHPVAHHAENAEINSSRLRDNNHDDHGTRTVEDNRELASSKVLSPIAANSVSIPSRRNTSDVKSPALSRYSISSVRGVGQYHRQPLNIGHNSRANIFNSLYSSMRSPATASVAKVSAEVEDKHMYVARQPESSRYALGTTSMVSHATSSRLIRNAPSVRNRRTLPYTRPTIALLPVADSISPLGMDLTQLAGSPSGSKGPTSLVTERRRSGATQIYNDWGPEQLRSKTESMQTSASSQNTGSGNQAAGDNGSRSAAPGKIEHTASAGASKARSKSALSGRANEQNHDRYHYRHRSEPESPSLFEPEDTPEKKKRINDALMNMLKSSKHKEAPKADPAVDLLIERFSSKSWLTSAEHRQRGREATDYRASFLEGAKRTAEKTLPSIARWEAEEQRRKEEIQRKKAEAERLKKEAEMRLRKIVRPLSDEWNDRVDAAMATRPQESHKKVTRRDLGSLLPQSRSEGIGWLNDEIINVYCNIVATKAREAAGQQARHPGAPKVHVFSSQMYTTYAKQRDIKVFARWNRRAKLEGKQMLDAELVFIPINDHSHWTVVLVNPKSRTITYYDSLSGGGSTYTAFALAWVKMTLGDGFKADEWKIVASKSARQTNAIDCGVFVCMNTLALVKGLDPLHAFGPNDAQEARRIIAATLINDEINEELGF